MHSEKDLIPNTRAVCGARCRRQPLRTCRNRAGQRTTHEGIGRCWLHGGATPIKHGRYSTITRISIREELANELGRRVSRANTSQLLEELWRAVTTYVKDETLLDSIRAELHRRVGYSVSGAVR